MNSFSQKDLSDAIDKAEELKEKKTKRKQFNNQQISEKIDKNYKGVNNPFFEVVIKIEVKDNNAEQALRVLKRKLQRDGFFKVIKLKNTYEKPSEKKKEFSKKYKKSEKIK